MNVAKKSTAVKSFAILELAIAYRSRHSNQSGQEVTFIRSIVIAIAAQQLDIIQAINNETHESVKVGHRAVVG
jgi:hypothetical protein